MSSGLWKQYYELKNKCKFVDLSHELSEQTPHWSGFSKLSKSVLFDYEDGFLVNEMKFVTQYGTHVDAPSHFVKGARPLDKIKADELVMPLCVVDITKKVEKDVDYGCTAEDIKEWEKIYGNIPEGAFVALRTDWSKRKDLDNFDKDGNKHYPAWNMDGVKYLVEQRNIGAIGHETSDTDTAVNAAALGYLCELYILEQNRYQIELMCNLDKLPPVGALIFCGFPRFKDGPGFPARCIAVYIEE